MSLVLKLMEDGGPIMWVILFCSVVALFIFLKKVFQFHREEINIGEVLRGLFNVLRRDGFVEALTLCDHTPGPAARLLAAAIRAYERGDEDIRKAVDDAALEEIPKLERHINLLGTLGFVLPLIGFAIILKQCVKRNFEFIYFVFGFILFTVFKVSVIAILVVSLVFALADFRYGKTSEEGGSNE